MLIDFHVHVFPDQLAKKAVQNIFQITKNRPSTDGTLSDTLFHMDQWKVDHAVIQHIATKPTQQSPVNHWAAQIQSERIFCFGSVYPSSPDALMEAERIKKLRLHGIKLHPDYQNFCLDDPNMFPLYDVICELGLPVLFHMGHNILDPDHSYAAPKRLSQVAQQFPKLTIIAAHMGGAIMWDQVEEHLLGKDLYLDTSLSARFCPPEQYARMIRQHDSQRILFASDSPWSSAQEEFQFLQALSLPSATMDRICYQNAQEILGISK